MANFDTDKLGECPSCGGVFKAVQIGTYKVDQCETCGGVWMDERELDKVLALDHKMLKQKKGQPPAQHKSKTCPRCSGTLIKVTNMRANVQTDSCTVCYGVFLDSGELDAFDHPNLAAGLASVMRKLIGKH